MIDTKEISEKLIEFSQSASFPTTELQEALKEVVRQEDWTNIHLSFTDELIQQWKEKGFTHQQVQDWINIGLTPMDYNLCAWLRDTKQLTSEQVLNHGNLEKLNQEFFTWWQEQQAQVEIPPKS
ncbi:MAG: hypothetical protein MRERC_7c006 [Mycoplasmataceae bacterium RC_NB112A]|nr:MAG: hypothetical protein MRERC_10c049 [Mycoplasmataceae bacterium RC_NB112A]KLL01856.1 MAG: hypothetical protein MRERC_7c006 [Mycoplasmataceae bacterium RC_NB112A]